MTSFTAPARVIALAALSACMGCSGARPPSLVEARQTSPAPADVPCGSVPVGDTSLEPQYPTSGNIVYVSAAAPDGGDGSQAHPYNSLWIGANPGDTVLVGDGVYGGLHPSSGNANAWIVYKAAPGAHPKFTPTSNTAIWTDGASYFVIDGFEIAGNQANLGPGQANVDVSGMLLQNSHHVVVRNNVVHDLPLGGIVFMDSDYVTIDHNITYNNAHWSDYAGSGISIGWAKDIDSNTGVKNVISNNVTYSNEELVPCVAGCGGTPSGITDGNGIIIDTNNANSYGGRTLVVNNVSFNNGGSGMHAWYSDHVDFINNTIYHNAQNVSEPQLNAGSSSDVTMFNNIVVADAGKPAGAGTSGVTSDYNLFFGGVGTPTTHAHDVVADPKFVNAGCADFRLQAGSPAVDAGGSPAGVPAFDLLNVSRPQGAHYDVGAYELVSSPDGGAPKPSSTIRIAAGQSVDYTDPAGTIWSADWGFSGGQTVTRPATQTIGGTNAQPLYRSERYGDGAGFAYALPVPNGAYDVTLKFAETFVTGPGQRLFDVSINGTTALQGFDILAAAGGMNVAVDKTFAVDVSDGAIRLSFAPGAVQNPKVDAIEIVPRMTAPSDLGGLDGGEGDGVVAPSSADGAGPSRSPAAHGCSAVGATAPRGWPWLVVVVLATLALRTSGRRRRSEAVRRG